MRNFIIAALLLMPVTAFAQDNTWEMPEPTQQQGNPDAKYLEGAVPEVDGRVVFQTTIEAPGKSARQLYDILLPILQQQCREAGQFEQSRIVIQDTTTMQLVASYQEWLVFKNQPLSLDRTRLMYHIIVDCADGQASIQMTRIYYLYDEERQPQTYRAEEWITDRYGLNRSKTKLARISGKFRRKTIDRKDYLFGKYTRALQQ
ncbi:MAG: DUF4468 domain-containing protein [Prevotella sp.]|nr:DUF4468 domain-containing protein [Prevotella sp.]